jgi:serine/threonine protein kinase
MKSIIRNHLLPPITLDEFYKKVANNEFQPHLKLQVEDRENKKHTLEILSVLGRGRSGCVFLSRKDRKLAALRMSYEQEKITGKFESIIEDQWQTYKKLFLDILAPSVTVHHLAAGPPGKKQIIPFDKPTYAGLWEKAETTLVNKLDAPFETKLRWFRQLLQGLHFIHSRDRVHCDIKLDNLFLVNNRLKIGDFEFYSRVDDFKQSEILICGTPGHIAPEMFDHKENISPRIDIFSAGIAFAQLFSGKEHQHIQLLPEENQKLTEALDEFKKINPPGPAHIEDIEQSLAYLFFYRRQLENKIQTAPPGSLERFVYEDIILEMLALDPARRPDAGAILHKLDSRAPTRAKKRFNASRLMGSLWFLAGFLPVIAAAAIIYFFLFKGSLAVPNPQPRETTAAQTNPPPVNKKENKKNNPDKTSAPPKIIKPKPAPDKKKQEPKKLERKEKPGQLDHQEQAIKRQLQQDNEEYEKGLALVEKKIDAGNFSDAFALIDALKEIKIDARLLALENKASQESAAAAEKLRQEEREYKKHLQNVQRYMSRGDYQNAEYELKKARQLKNSALLQQLEKKLRRLQEKTRQDYEKYRKWALIYFEHDRLEDALQNAELALAIYRSHEMVVLETRIREKLREQKQQEAGRKADNLAYNHAIKTNNLWDLDDYIRRFPHGRHASEVNQRINEKLRDSIPRVEEPPLRKRVEPAYTGRIRRDRITGVVTLEVVIDNLGRVTEAEAVSGPDILRYPAKKAVKQWFYQPVIIGNKPRTVWFTVKIPFGQEPS